MITEQATNETYCVAEMSGIGTEWRVYLALANPTEYWVTVASGPVCREKFRGTWLDSIAYVANEIQAECEAESDPDQFEELPALYGVRGDRLATVDENGNVR